MEVLQNKFQIREVSSPINSSPEVCQTFRTASPRHEVRHIRRQNLVNTYAIRTQLKDLEDGADDEQNPSLEQTGGSEASNLQMSLKDLQYQSFETGVQDEQAKKRSTIPDWFSQPQTTFSDHHGISLFLPFMNLPNLALTGFTVQKYDDVLYKFKEATSTELRSRHKNMQLLLVLGKVTNLSIEETQRDKANARAMIQAIDKRLKTRRSDELERLSVTTLRGDLR
ncbi:hypothetical protein Tco_1517519 [Tanacetum coccineum]